MVLILKNIPMEGPGTIGDFLSAEKIPFKTVELSAGEELPSPGGFSHVVVMGGPMAVYEMEEETFLKKEAEFLKEAIGLGNSVLGVCLGAQLVSHVLGGRVYPGGVKEIGWQEVSITPDGMKDPVFSALSSDGRPFAEVFQWHGDTFELPAGSLRLSFNENYPNQAFRYGNKVYALQFHIEVTPRIVMEWFEGEKDFDVRLIVSVTERLYPEYLKRAEEFYRRFFG